MNRLPSVVRTSAIFHMRNPGSRIASTSGSVFTLNQQQKRSFSGSEKLQPLLDRVLVERFVPETKTKGGIMIPEKAQAKINSGTVVAVGTGGRGENGQTIPVTVKTGDKVLLPEYGGQKIEIDSKEYYIFRDSDILGKWT